MTKSRIIHRNYPRKQHIIPRAYLNRFADTKGKLFVYEALKEIRKSSAQKEASERDYFECKVPGRETNYSFEERLEKIERGAQCAYDNLLIGRALSTLDIAHWSLYVASLFLRSRRLRLELSAHSFERFSRSAINPNNFKEDQWEIYRRTGQLVSQDEIRKASIRALEQLSDPVFRQLNSIDISTPNLARILVTKRWQVVRACKGKSFVTCDAPALSFQIKGDRCYPGCGWGLSDAFVALPLNSECFFIASPMGAMFDEHLDATNTQTMIELTVKFAHRYVFAKEPQSEIQLLLNAYSGTMVFGRDAFQLDPDTKTE